MKLFDITRGSPHRIKGQYRRHLSFAPATWNLLFRANVNLDASLFVKRKAMDQKPSTTSIETDVAMAAANLLELLETGYYVTLQGKRRLPCIVFVAYHFFILRFSKHPRH